jgi:molecular chaperone GrpE
MIENIDSNLMNNSDADINKKSSFYESADPDDSIDVPDTSMEDVLGILNELKTDSRRQQRSFRKFIENYNEISSEIDLKISELGNSRGGIDKKELQPVIVNAQFEARLALLKTMFDVRDALDRGVAETRKRFSQMSFLRKMIVGAALIESLIQGQEISLKRMDDVLASYGILKIKSDNEIFDPQTMRAVAAEKCEYLEEGIVLETLRSGYILDAKVLRFAEVRVARH